MSGAVAGRDDGFQYQFTIGGEPEPVLDFYKLALPPLGWELLARGTGYQGEPLMTFLKEGQVLGLSVTPVASEDSLLLVTVSFP
jgi:hypothetical protein